MARHVPYRSRKCKGRWSESDNSTSEDEDKDDEKVHYAFLDGKVRRLRVAPSGMLQDQSTGSVSRPAYQSLSEFGGSYRTATTLPNQPLGLSQNSYLSPAPAYNMDERLGQLEVIGTAADFRHVGTATNRHGYATAPSAAIRLNSPVTAFKSPTASLSLMATRPARASSVVYDLFDTNTIASWLEKCRSEHGGHCQSLSWSSDEPSGRPVWLFDVVQERLKPALPADRYAALSYVWGQTKMLETTKENLNSFQEPKGLMIDRLPRTVGDAARLAQFIGIPYLWVDCICLVQNDEETKHKQIADMAGIYSNADITFVAAAGRDADAGLRLVEWMVSEKLGRAPRRHRPKPESTWVERAWTMQELLFSPRNLLIFEDTISWECCCANRHACIISDADDELEDSIRKQVASTTRKLQYSSWPDLEEYARLVCEFNRKKLTFPEDILKAFAGVITTFSHTFENGFLYGLPLMFFDVALLWQPFGILKRRVAVGYASAEVLPSWSWVGWEGSLDPRCWACGYDYVQEVESEFRRKIQWKKTSVRVIPTVTWFCSDPTPADRERIHSTWQRLKRANIHTDWSEHHDGSPVERYFSHKSTQLTKFEYPIPIRDPAIIPQPSALKPFLHCVTRRAIFYFGRPGYLTGKPGEGSEFIFKKIYPSKESTIVWGGIIRTNNTRYENSKLQGPCELVEISAGTALNSEDEHQYLEEWMLSQRPKTNKLYEFYNVLWIRWIKGIAYRKALGRVVKEVWEAAATEEIDLVLG